LTSWTTFIDIFHLRIKKIEIIQEEIEDLAFFLGEMMEPSEKLGFLVQRLFFHILIKDELRSGKPSPQLLDENFLQLSYAMMFTRNLPYTETFKNLVNQLITSGIVTEIQNERLLKHIPERTSEKIPPQVLTLEHLAVGFAIYLVATAFCVLVFVIEKIFSGIILIIKESIVHKLSNLTPQN
jgi:hypothetical protein